MLSSKGKFFGKYLKEFLRNCILIGLLLMLFKGISLNAGISFICVSGFAYLTLILDEKPMLRERSRLALPRIIISCALSLVILVIPSQHLGLPSFPHAEQIIILVAFILVETLLLLYWLSDQETASESRGQTSLFQSFLSASSKYTLVTLAWSLIVFAFYNIQIVKLTPLISSLQFLWKRLFAVSIATYAAIFTLLFFASRDLKTWRSNAKNTSQNADSSFKVDYKAEYLILSLIILFSFYIKTQVFNFNYNFPDHFLLPILASDILKQGILSVWHHLPIGANWNFLTGEGYFSVVVLPLLASYKIFGASNISTYAVFIAISLTSLFLFYFLVRKFFRAPTAAATTFLYGISGWHVILSTYPRFYSLMELVLIATLIVLIEIKQQPQKRVLHNLFFIGLALLLLINVQAFLVFSVLFALYLLGKSTVEKINIFLLALLPLYTQLSLFANATILHQFIGYHTSLNFFVAFAIFVGTCLIFASKKEAHIILFLLLAGLYLLPITAIFLDADLMDRYTNNLFPAFFLIAFGSLIELYLGDSPAIRKRPVLQKAFVSLIIICLVLTCQGFVFNKKYELNTLWPKNYNISTDKLETKQSDRVLDTKTAYDFLIKNGYLKNRPDECLLDIDAFTLDWYTKINEETALGKTSIYWLSSNPDVKDLLAVSGDLNTKQHGIVDFNYYHRYTGIPVIQNYDELEKLGSACTDIFIIISKNYQYIIDQTTRNEISMNSELLYTSAKLNLFRFQPKDKEVSR